MTVLIPTDFSIDSIQVLKSYLKQNPNTKPLKVVFGAGFDIGNSIHNLMFYSKNKIHKKLQIEAFENALDIIRNKYSNSIETIEISFFTGWNQASFNHFLEGNKIEDIIYAQDGILKSNNKNWFDITPRLKNCKLHKTTVETEYVNESEKEYHSFSPLFSN